VILQCLIWENNYSFNFSILLSFIASQRKAKTFLIGFHQVVFTDNFAVANGRESCVNHG